MESSSGTEVRDDESRYFDDAIFAAYFEGKTPVFNMAKGPVPGEMHQSFGQEPCAVGIVAQLGPDDVVGAAHRPHRAAWQSVCRRSCGRRQNQLAWPRDQIAAESQLSKWDAR